MDTVARVQIVDETVCISNNSKNLDKRINQTNLCIAGKIVLYYLGVAISLV